MKVLIAHNRYVSDNPSGENQVVDAEIEMLEKAGVDVVTQIETSDSLKGASKRRMLEAGIGPVYAPSGVARFRKLLDAERPDVVHLHNPNPLLSPWVVRVAHTAGVPVVQTVHNYRHSCVSGLHYRNGKSCTDCLGKPVPVSAVRNGCYQGSALRTAPVAVGQVLHKPTWRMVSRFLALTPFMADVLRKAGLPDDRISIRPSWVPDAGPVTVPGTELLFVGRLDEAKGIRLLLEAWRRGGSASGRLLRIAGDGPLRAEVEAAASGSPESIRYEGWVNSTRVTELMDRSAALVVPSLCFEGYPLVVAQAFGRGRGVLAVTGGSAGSIVASSAGWTAAPEVDDLGRAIRRITASEVKQHGAAARRRYVAENSPGAGLKTLLDAYADVTADGRVAR